VTARFIGHVADTPPVRADPTPAFGAGTVPRVVGPALLAIGLGVVGGLMALKPRAVWWRLSAWAYRNPEANEPSDIAYGLQSLLLGVAAIGCVASGVVLLGMENPEEREEREGREEARCEEVMAELERSYDSGGVEAVRARGRDLGVETDVREAGVPPVPGQSADIPPSVWVYDRDLPEQEQLLGTVGGLASNTMCT
jgi:hypothetical protein